MLTKLSIFQLRNASPRRTSSIGVQMLKHWLPMLESSMSTPSLNARSTARQHFQRRPSSSPTILKMPSWKEGGRNHAAARRIRTDARQRMVWHRATYGVAKVSPINTSGDKTNDLLMFSSLIISNWKIKRLRNWTTVNGQRHFCRRPRWKKMYMCKKTIKTHKINKTKQNK